MQPSSSSRINIASVSHGARVVSCSSHVQGCEASNVLSDNLSQIWLSKDAVPQWICISFKDASDMVKAYPVTAVGWHCWHIYTTNPSLVTVHISADGRSFKRWVSCTAGADAGNHVFACPPFDLFSFPYITFEINESFGADQIYLNRIILLSQNQNNTSTRSFSQDIQSFSEESHSDTSFLFRALEQALHSNSDIQIQNLDDHPLEKARRAQEEHLQNTNLPHVLHTPRTATCLSDYDDNSTMFEVPLVPPSALSTSDPVPELNTSTQERSFPDKSLDMSRLMQTMGELKSLISQLQEDAPHPPPCRDSNECNNSTHSSTQPTTFLPIPNDRGYERAIQTENVPSLSNPLPVLTGDVTVSAVMRRLDTIPTRKSSASPSLTSPPQSQSESNGWVTLPKSTVGGCNSEGSAVSASIQNVRERGHTSDTSHSYSESKRPSRRLSKDSRNRAHAHSKPQPRDTYRTHSSSLGPTADREKILLTSPAEYQDLRHIVQQLHEKVLQRTIKQAQRDWIRQRRQIEAHPNLHSSSHSATALPTDKTNGKAPR